jgi:hypothetical protein
MVEVEQRQPSPLAPEAVFLPMVKQVAALAVLRL